MTRRRQSPNESELTNKRPKIELDTRLWTEKHKPLKIASLNISELYINSSKIKFLTEWFENLKTNYSNSNYNRRILICYGPSGSCKSTTISLFIKEYEFYQEDWKSPILLQQPKQRAHNSDNIITNESSFPKHSEIDHFEQFLKSNLKYSTGRNKEKRIIVIDDLPNITHESILAKLNNILLNICKSNYLVPIILCFNEFSNWSLHKTIDKSILANAKVTLFKLNKVPPTLVDKALKRVMELEFSLLDRANPALMTLVQKLVKTELGDLRSLINHFQFYCLNYDNIDFGSLFEKDPSIEFFRTIGKVFYAKRGPNEDTKSTKKLVWKNHPNDIVKSMQVNDMTLTHYLFQNYPSFCDDIDQAVGLSEIYSEYDALDSFAYNQEIIDIKNNFTLIQIWLTMDNLINNNDDNNRDTSNFCKISKPNYFQETKQFKQNLNQLNYFKFNLIKHHFLKINGLVLSDNDLSKVYLPYFSNIGLNGFSKIPQDCKYFIQRMSGYNYNNNIYSEILKEDEIVNQFHSIDAPIVDFKELNQVFGVDQLFVTEDDLNLSDPIED